MTHPQILHTPRHVEPMATGDSDDGDDESGKLDKLVDVVLELLSLT